MENTTEQQRENSEVVTSKESKRFNFGKFHDKYYKTLILIPLALVIFSLVYMGVFYSNNNDFFYKDISLTGGTTVTILEKIDSPKLMQDLTDKLEDINTREIYDLITNEQKATIVETKTDAETTKKVLEEYLGHELTSENSSFEFTGATLSESFYKQLLVAMLFAFIFMAIVVFIIFRTIVPSTAVIFSAFADILMTVVLVDMLGIRISSAGITAFLMLIGFSVDTDILLTARILKRGEGTINERLFSSFKTGMTMTLTAIFAVLSALFIVNSFSLILTQIFAVLAIGLGFDLINTWVTNVSLLKWYAKSKENKAGGKNEN